MTNLFSILKISFAAGLLFFGASINAAKALCVANLNGYKSGTVITLPAGETCLTGDLTLDSTITKLTGAADHGSTLSAENGLIVIENSGSGSSALEISGVVFENVHLRIEDSSNNVDIINNVIYDTHYPELASDEDIKRSYQIKLANLNAATTTVKNNILLRGAAYPCSSVSNPCDDNSGVLFDFEGGHAISVYNTRDVNISENLIGGVDERVWYVSLIDDGATDKRKLLAKLAANGVPIYKQGFYGSAVQFHSIDNSLNSPPPGTPGTGHLFPTLPQIELRDNIITGVTDDKNSGAPGAFDRDHVIYFTRYNGAEICGNHFSGWYNDASGGVKLRNSDKTIVCRNRFDDVNLRTTNYENFPNINYFNNVYILENTFKDSIDEGSSNNPISYWERCIRFDVPTETCTSNSSDPGLYVSEYYVYGNEIESGPVSLQIYFRSKYLDIASSTDFYDPFDPSGTPVLFTKDNLVDGSPATINAHAMAPELSDTIADTSPFSTYFANFPATTPTLNNAPSTTPTSGDDVLLGGQSYDSIYASGGNDILVAGTNTGGTNSALRGEAGDDTYVFLWSEVETNATESGGSGTDVIVLAAVPGAIELVAEKSGSFLRLGHADSQYIAQLYKPDVYPFELLRFGDGSQVSFNYTGNGTSADELIVTDSSMTANVDGGAGDDILVEGASYAYALYGGHGSDTYIAKAGETTRISEANSGSGGDRVVAKFIEDQSDLKQSRVGSFFVLESLTNSGDIEIYKHCSDADYIVETVIVADGSEVTLPTPATCP